MTNEQSNLSKNHSVRFGTEKTLVFDAATGETTGSLALMMAKDVDGHEQTTQNIKARDIALEIQAKKKRAEEKAVRFGYAKHHEYDTETGLVSPKHAFIKVKEHDGKRVIMRTSVADSQKLTQQIAAQRQQMMYTYMRYLCQVKHVNKQTEEKKQLVQKVASQVIKVKRAVASAQTQQQKGFFAFLKEYCFPVVSGLIPGGKLS